MPAALLACVQAQYRPWSTRLYLGISFQQRQTHLPLRITLQLPTRATLALPGPSSLIVRLPRALSRRFVCVCCGAFAFEVPSCSCPDPSARLFPTSKAVDSIGLGLGANTGYAIYTLATTTTVAAEQYLLARAQNAPSKFGWSASYYYGEVIAGVPYDGNGSLGLRTMDSGGGRAGGYIGVGGRRTLPQLYSFVTTNGALTANPSDLQRWFGRPRISGWLNGAAVSTTPGFYGTGSTAAINLPVAVDQRSPAVTTAFTLSVGVPPTTGDVTRSWDGSLHTALIFRSSHSAAMIATVSNWINTNYYRMCPIELPS